MNTIELVNSFWYDHNNYGYLILFQREVSMNQFHWQTYKYTYTQTQTCTHSTTYWNFQFWITMWSCFHWRFILILSLPHSTIFPPQVPNKVWIHRHSWNVLKWWSQWFSIFENQKKKIRLENWFSPLSTSWSKIIFLSTLQHCFL